MNMAGTGSSEATQYILEEHPHLIERVLKCAGNEHRSIGGSRRFDLAHITILRNLSRLVHEGSEACWSFEQAVSVRP